MLLDNVAVAYPWGGSMYVVGGFLHVFLGVLDTCSDYDPLSVALLPPPPPLLPYFTTCFTTLSSSMTNHGATRSNVRTTAGRRETYRMRRSAARTTREATARARVVVVRASGEEKEDASTSSEEKPYQWTGAESAADPPAQTTPTQAPDTPEEETLGPLGTAILLTIFAALFLPSMFFTAGRSLFEGDLSAPAPYM